MISIKSLKNQPEIMKRNQRKGYSLVEMLVVISASAAVLMVAYMMLTMVMRQTAMGNNQQARGESLARVVAGLRKAVHESAGGRVAEDGKVLELSDMNSSGSARLRFNIVDKPFRIEVVDVKSGGRQILGLTGFTKGQFRVEKPESFEKTLVTLDLWPTANRKQGRDQDSSVPYLIQAAIGLDLIEKGPAGGSGK